MARRTALAIGMMCVPAAQALPPVEAFAELPFVAQPSLSPDGRYLATIQVHEGRPIVVVRDLTAPQSLPTAIPSANWLIAGISWAKPDRLLLFITNAAKASNETLYTWYRVASVRPDGSGMAFMLEGKEHIKYNTGVGVTDLAPDDPKHIYMPYFSFTRSGSVRSDLQKVDLETGRGTRVALSSEQTREWFLDHGGRVVARLDHTTNPLKDWLKVPDGKNGWRVLQVYDSDADKGAGTIGLTPDGTAMVRVAGDDRSLVLSQVNLTPHSPSKSLISLS